MNSEYRYLTFNQLLSQLKGDKATYSDLLCTTEWRQLRVQIISRDEHKCTKCTEKATEYERGKHFRYYSEEEIVQLVKEEVPIPPMHFGDVVFHPKRARPVGCYVDKPRYLHVHHKLYFLNKLPWEYERRYLTTLCNVCHTEFHKTNSVPYYRDERMEEELEMNLCPRCNGEGYFPEFSHIDGGVCFNCRGAKYLELIGIYK